MHFSLWLTAAPLLVENFQAMPPLVDNSEEQLSPFLHSARSLVRIIQYFLLLSISSNYGLLLIAQTWLSNDTADEAVAILEYESLRTIGLARHWAVSPCMSVIQYQPFHTMTLSWVAFGMVYSLELMP